MYFNKFLFNFYKNIYLEYYKDYIYITVKELFLGVRFFAIFKKRIVFVHSIFLDCTIISTFISIYWA